MHHFEQILSAHPEKGAFDVNTRLGYIKHIAVCKLTCSSCADACLSEQMVDQLRKCIRLNANCAAACAATISMLIHQGEGEPEVLRKQVEACEAACRFCAEECERHASMHEHCKICAESCRSCEQVCQEIAKSQLVTV